RREAVMWTQFVELSIPTKILILLGPILFLIALRFSLRAREFSWPNIAVIGIAMVGLLLPSIQKFSVSKDAVSFEQFQNGVSSSRDAISELQKNTEENAKAIAALHDSISEIKSSYSNLIARQNETIATVAKAAPNPSGSAPPVEHRELNQIQEDLKRSDAGITRKLEQADKA